MYCIKCLKYYAKHKLQNINRCCRGQICKICIKQSNYMCFYCKAHSSRYMENEELRFDKAYKYIIRKYKHKNIIYRCVWYINLNYDRKDDKFTYIDFNRHGKVCILEWQSNGKLDRNYDKPTTVSLGFIVYGEGFLTEPIFDRINYLSWRQKGILHREENKPSVIQLHFNGNIRKLEWYYNDVRLHINKLYNLHLNKNGDID